ncbi:septum formation protein Maf [Gammaproteobacteria bacterium LSUCC0057]|uniref:7-methyl-GTP pyrophosphatase n=1 Tax=Gammaproteobacteria bacterium LSUCC0057 TaxID=2559237 RepID=A0A4Y8UKE3_9GAMM|nr:septum formation protein Maf [Gammaproteobacteria bacterium LSUCC0057]
MSPLILASSSVWRHTALARLGLQFTCQSPEIDETAAAGEHCEQLATRLAAEKMAVIAAKNSESVVIGSDQVACHQGQPLAKPTTMDQLRQQLLRQSGATVTFYTAVCVGRGEWRRQFCDTTHVQFKRLSAAQIERYLQREQPLGCAGGFQVEGFGIALFEQIRSSDPTALVGLPLLGLSALLAEFGLDPLG